MECPAIGAHVSAAGGIDRTVERATSIGCDAVQLFVSSPRVWKVPPLSEELIASYNEKSAVAGIRAALVHGLYLCNLASDNSELVAKSVEALSAQLDSANSVHADLCFHVGSHQGRGLEGALPGIAEAIKRCLEHAPNQWLLLENSAGAGGTVGRSVEELAAIIDAAGRPERLGVCLDSCHLYVSGYDLTDAEEVDGFFSSFDRLIGLDRLRAIHANDALTELGSNRDRHANIDEGKMGAGLGVFLRHQALAGVPVFLETPGGAGSGPDADEVRKLREFYR